MSTHRPEQLGEPIAQLDKAQKVVARESREAQAAADAKAKAMTTNDDLFGRAATFISAALELIGDDVLAARVRPVARRPGTAVGAAAPGDVVEEETPGAAPAPTGPQDA